MGLPTGYDPSGDAVLISHQHQHQCITFVSGKHTGAQPPPVPAESPALEPLDHSKAEEPGPIKVTSHIHLQGPQSLGHMVLSWAPPASNGSPARTWKLPASQITQETSQPHKLHSINTFTLV